MTSTRVLVVGSGFIAGEHLNALHQLPDAEIAGIVDLDPGRAAAAARAAGGVPWATDLAAAITEWSADAAIVCTPNHTHPAIGRTLAEAGVHALIEKPLAITPAAAAELVELFEQRGLVLSAAHTHRYAAYARAVREAIVDGAVGRPRHARITLLGGWIWGDWRNWQIDRNRSGGHALHNGVHLLDLVTWWLDDVPTHLHAAGRKRAAADLEVDDYLMITVGYASGATAVCEMSRANQPRGIGYREVFVQGDGGTLRLPWDNEGLLSWGHDGTRAVPAGPSPFLAQARTWLAAVRGESLGEEPVTGRTGLAAVVLGDAAERSLATGSMITLTPEEAR
ncbi:MAG TPA: Gfo/Idh/MocA family oxidoreductase [Microlunatus sp.]|nr:Gfo/Idh/MocA family oxidoreductase [Microlunatus sp.]